MEHAKISITIAATAIALLLVSDTGQSQINRQTQQGKTIQLNGQPWTGHWIKRVDSKNNTSIFLQDNWLGGALGIELLDSDRPEQQRLRWFSVPFFADVTFDQPVQRRYLDIKDMAVGWRTEIVGEVLSISTPDTVLQSIRRSKQGFGDRLVLDLSRRTPWQLQQQGDVISLIISADLAPAIARSVSTTKGNLIKAVEVQSQGKQTIIKIQTTEQLQPEIQTLGDPNRMIIDIKRNYLPPDLTIAWAKGLIRKQQTISLRSPNQSLPKSLNFAVTSLIVDLKQPGITMRPIWSNPDGMTGTSSLRTIAEQSQVAAAINGGFFNRDRRMPVGAIRESKRWMAGGVLTRGAVAWNLEGEVFMDRLSFSEELVTSKQETIPITHLNSGYVQNGLARYTPNWGANYIPLTENEIIMVVQGDRVTSQFQGGDANEGQIAIPDNGYVLVARKTPELATKLPVGEQIKGVTNVLPNNFANYPNLLGAGPLLLKNGNIVLDAKLEKFRPPFDTTGASRSAIATFKENSKDSSKIILTTIQATPEGILPSLPQTAEILKKLGAVNALNLDGGGSTTMYLGGAVLNRALSSVGAIHNALGIFINAPNGKEQF